MSVFSASRTSFPLGRSTRRPVGQSAATWARSQFTDRATRRLAAAGQRAVHRIQQHLGPLWHVVGGPHPGLVTRDQSHAGFLVIGPGGVFAISVVDQGRTRVMIAGNVIQIQGRRPPYVARAKRYARTARTALTSAVGSTVPVVPVLTFVGNGAISAHGLPTDCLVVSHRELDRLLTAGGDKISPETALKLAEVAAHPATWDEQYRWYPDGQTAVGPGDKDRTRR
jgi:hypothetical protein